MAVIRPSPPRRAPGSSRRRRLPSATAAAVVALGAAFAPAPPPATAVGQEHPWEARPATYQVAVEPDVRVTMSDGLRLALDVLRPADGSGRPVDGRFPVLLTQTPYNKKPVAAQGDGRSGVDSYRNDYLVRRGYVQVIAEVRGTGSSEGAFEVFGRREQQDGAELVTWAASSERPWSNGRVGLLGSSYAGLNQLFTAALRPPGLRAIFPVSAAGDLYRDLVVPGGQADTTFMPLWFTLVTSFGLLPPTYSPSNPAGAGAALGAHAGQLPGTAAMVRDLGAGGKLSYDGAWWWERSPLDAARRVAVPAFVVGGWHDLFQRGAPMLYERLTAAGGDARLVVGPWDHWDLVGRASHRSRLVIGGHSLDEWQLRWFDRHVEGRADPEPDGLAPVTYCPVGEVTCRGGAAWPPPGVVYRALFPGGPAGGPETGTLNDSPPDGQGPDVLVSHQGSGSCTRSSSQWGWAAYSGARSPCDSDQRANDPTGLVYDLRLRDDLRIAGPIAARLFAATNGRDGFLMLRLEDVAPDGRVVQLTSGGLTLSMRALDRPGSVAVGDFLVRPHHPFTEAAVLPVEDGEIYELWIEIVATAATVPAGHRLRLAVQPSDWPHQSPSLRQAGASAGNVLSLYHDADHPSALVLPVERGPAPG